MLRLIGAGAQEEEAVADDEQTSVRMLKRAALEAPARQRAENSSVHGGVVAIDPTKVVRTARENVAPVASRAIGRSLAGKKAER